MKTNLLIGVLFGLPQILQAADVNQTEVESLFEATYANDTETTSDDLLDDVENDSSNEISDLNNTSVDGLLDKQVNVTSNTTEIHTSDEANEINSTAPSGPAQAIADAILSSLSNEDGEIDPVSMDNVEASGVSHLYIKHLARLAYREIISFGGTKEQIAEEKRLLRGIKARLEEENGAYKRSVLSSRPKKMRYRPKKEHAVISVAVLKAIRSYGTQIEGIPLEEALRGENLHLLLANAVDGALREGNVQLDVA